MSKYISVVVHALKFTKIQVRYLNTFAYFQVRDLSIAYILVALTYIPIGVLFYSAFPMPKYCVVDVSSMSNLYLLLSSSYRQLRIVSVYFFITVCFYICFSFFLSFFIDFIVFMCKFLV